MCRWLAYTGAPVEMAALITRPVNSLIHQSRESSLGVEALNGDGFGVGWYTDRMPEPALFRSLQPAWADRNLEEISNAVESGLFIAHVRATTGTPVQQTNCHPFRHGRWLWAHNGLIRDFSHVKRDLVLAVDPELFPYIEGTTDSEVMFHLALTYGLQSDPVGAVTAMIAFVEDVGRAHGIEHPIQMTVATSDGTTLWVFRHSSEGHSRSLFFTRKAETVRALYPELPELQRLSDDARIVVSEPLRDLPGAWVEVPEDHCGVVGPDQEALIPLDLSA